MGTPRADRSRPRRRARRSRSSADEIPAIGAEGDIDTSPSCSRLKNLFVTFPRARAWTVLSRLAVATQRPRREKRARVMGLHEK